MTQQRAAVEFKVDEFMITALVAAPEPPSGLPLIAALHGGTYTGRYFDVAGSPQGSFMDIAAASGYPVISLPARGPDGGPAL
jgi:acetyl esterase/lipase